MPHTNCALGGHLPHVKSRFHELIAGEAAHRWQAGLGPFGGRDRPVEATLASDDHSFAHITQHWVGWALETAPGARARGPPLFHPHHLTAQQQAQIVLQDGGHVGGERAIGTAAEVGNIHRNPATGFEHAHALGEHVAQHLQVLEVVRWYRPFAECLLIGLPSEIGRRCHHQGHRVVRHIGHGTGIAHHDLVHHTRWVHRLVIAHFGW